MLKRLVYILLYIVFVSPICLGQEADPGPGYQMIMMNNPAFSGAEGEGILRLSYLNYYPGNHYNLHSVYSSYDSYYQSLHGGAGVWVSDDYLGGIINDLRGGLTYAYFLQAGKNLFINAGLSASLYHRGFNFDRALLPDQIDPLNGGVLPSGESLASRGRTVFDIGTGFLFISGNLFGGISLNHLAEPDLSISGATNEKLKRKLMINLGGDIKISETHNLTIRPLGFFELQGGFVSAGGGTVFESNYLSLNAILIGNSSKNMNVQTGFSIKAGKVSIYYNYRFNIASGNNSMPFSLLHQTGLAFSLNNVEKRNLIKTINFPKL
jgi:type IX secretion system PorP/SprF family membrane protein